jgi:hypothetical protein
VDFVACSLLASYLNVMSTGGGTERQRLQIDTATWPVSLATITWLVFTAPARACLPW